MRVVALIVTFNRLAMLQDTVKRSLQMPFERVMVINNASTDETAAWLNGFNDPRLIVAHQICNTGGAGGFAAGLAALADMPGWTHVCLYDDDARPANNWLAELSRQPPADIWLSDVRDALNQPCKMNLPFTRLPQTVWQTLCYLASPAGWLPKATKCTPVVTLTFVGCCLRRAMLPKMLEVLDTRLFLYFDDLTAGAALARQGIRLMWCPALRFQHDIHVRAGVPPERRRLLTRNLLWLSRCKAGAPWGTAVTLLRVLGQLAAALKGPEKCRGIAAWGRGIREGLRGPWEEVDD